ncbi:MAG: helix-turn-helix transcriptional regulator [Lachnospiraceae bacterium]|nr:helix-turn-helix transcriptional regulator [Lachnospiraceae bacterium]MCM1235200.1 helix-turn-helix transcriptional regulator [Ruminococcus flavefaciens]
MISYDNLWETMEKRGITKYSLIYHYGISSNTLRRMSHGEPITTSTINELCMILHCKPQDILSFTLTEEEKSFHEKREAEIAMRKKKRT